VSTIARGARAPANPSAESCERLRRASRRALSAAHHLVLSNGYVDSRALSEPAGRLGTGSSGRGRFELAKLRVYELARELGVDSKTLMKTLSEIGVSVRSASSPIELAVARRVRMAHAAAPPSLPAPARPRPLHPPRLRPAAASQRQTPGVLAAAEELFGAGAVRPEALSAANLPFGRDGYDLSWTRHFIEREVYDQFLAAGLDTFEADLAAQCLKARLAPSDLQLELGDRTVLSWLRSGHSAAQLEKTLRECREDPASAHLIKPAWVARQ